MAKAQSVLKSESLRQAEFMCFTLVRDWEAVHYSVLTDEWQIRWKNVSPLPVEGG
jgi:hypothetical protein